MPFSTANRKARNGKTGSTTISGAQSLVSFLANFLCKSSTTNYGAPHADVGILERRIRLQSPAGYFKMEFALGGKPSFPGATVQIIHCCKFSTALLSLLGIVLLHSLHQDLNVLFGVSQLPHSSHTKVTCTQASKSFQQRPVVKASLVLVGFCSSRHLP